MARGDRHGADDSESIAGASRSLDDTRLDAHAWVDRAFNAVAGFMQGIGEVVRSASDVAAGRRPAAGPAYRAPDIAELGEWYIDEMIAAETGLPIFTVTNGTRIVECHSREMAEQVLSALTEQGVRVRAKEQRAAGPRGFASAPAREER